jgi:hypothetical protein
MFCADCGATGVARTQWPGSDRLERIGWLLGALPGWIYCAYRHALRAKVCTGCGGANLSRETRASAERHAALAAAGPAALVFESGADPTGWPAHVRDARARLRRAPAWAAAWWLATASTAAPATALLALALIAPDLAQWRRRRSAARCEAWDASGRALRIELA